MLFTYRDDKHERYYQLGKMIPHLVHPFLPIHQLLYYGSLLYMVQNAEDDEHLKYGGELELL